MTDLGRLLDFAERSRLPGGGFGYLLDDGSVAPGRGQETWIVARMTHVFGLAALLGRPGAEELARHGVVALTDGPLRDAAHGGWAASTADPTKAAYVHAFAVLAGATATTAGGGGGGGGGGRGARPRAGGRRGRPAAARRRPRRLAGTLLGRRGRPGGRGVGRRLDDAVRLPRRQR